MINGSIRIGLIGWFCSWGLGFTSSLIACLLVVSRLLVWLIEWLVSCLFVWFISLLWDWWIYLFIYFGSYLRACSIFKSSSFGFQRKSKSNEGSKMKTWDVTSKKVSLSSKPLEDWLLRKVKPGLYLAHPPYLDDECSGCVCKTEVKPWLPNSVTSRWRWCIQS